MAEPEYLIPASIMLGEAWPSDLFRIGGAELVGPLLDRIGVSALDVSRPAHVEATLAFQDEAIIDLPGIAGMALVFGQTDGRTELHIGMDLSDPFAVRISEFPIRLRFPSIDVEAGPDGEWTVRGRAGRVRGDWGQCHADVRWFRADCRSMDSTALFFHRS